MEIKLSYGLKDGKILHISELSPEDRGASCGCLCPLCKGELIAKMGAKNRHHFAHSSGIECDIEHAQQTGLHLLAKQIIAENDHILLPGWIISLSEIRSQECGYFDGMELKIELPAYPAREYGYNKVELEKSYPGIIADAVIYIENQPCIVEIAVTHFVDDEKLKKTREIGISMIEIDLCELLKAKLDYDEIKSSVLNNAHNRKWIYNRVREKKLIEKQAEFNEKYRNYKDKQLKKEEWKNRHREEGIASLRQIMQSQNYKKALLGQRNDDAALRWKSQNSPLNGMDYFPFYLDIPITGEIVFNCDRRIWQGALFKYYIYENTRSYTEVFTINEVHDRIYKKKMCFEFDMHYVYRTNVDIHGVEVEVSFPYEVIDKYFQYLELLGFVSKFGQDIRPIAVKTMVPPNKTEATALKTAIDTVDQFDPDIDSLMYDRLMELLPPNE